MNLYHTGKTRIHVLACRNPLDHMHVRFGHRTLILILELCFDTLHIIQILLILWFNNWHLGEFTQACSDAWKCLCWQIGWQTNLLVRKRLGSESVARNRFHPGSSGIISRSLRGTIWEETSEERQLKALWGRLWQLISNYSQKSHKNENIIIRFRK